MPSWNEFVLIDNPRLGQDVTLLSPVLSVNFYLGRTDAEAVTQLYGEAMKLIQPELTQWELIHSKPVQVQAIRRERNLPATAPALLQRARRARR